MGAFDHIKDNQTPTQPVKQKYAKGLYWITTLIEYDTDGNAHVVRSFKKEAKESVIKQLKKDKYVPSKKTKTTEETLF